MGIVTRSAWLARILANQLVSIWFAEPLSVLDVVRERNIEKMMPPEMVTN